MQSWQYKTRPWSCLQATKNNVHYSPITCNNVPVKCVQSNKHLGLTQAWILALDIGKFLSKNRVMANTAASQRTQLPGVKLKKFMSYIHLKTQKYLTSIILSSSSVFFMNILIDSLLTQFFIFQSVGKVCLSKMIFYQYFVEFLSWLWQLLLWKRFICYYLALKTYRKYKPPLTL